MIAFAIEFHEFSIEVPTDIGEDVTHVLKCGLAEHASAVLSHKDQVDMHIECTMTAMSDIA
jgi:hypothetical protein